LLPRFSRTPLPPHNRAPPRGPPGGRPPPPSPPPPKGGPTNHTPPTGGPADVGVTKWIEDRANELLATRDVQRVHYEEALRSPHLKAHDFIRPYVLDLDKVVDTNLIRDARIRLGADPLGGSNLAYWEPIANVHGLNVTLVNPTLDPRFAFMPLDHDGKIRMDCSSPYAMANLVKLKDKFDVAFGNDADSDRHGIVTPRGGLMN